MSMKLFSSIFCPRHYYYYYLIGTISSSSSGMMIYSSSLSWKSMKTIMTTATNRAIHPVVSSSSLESSLHRRYYRSYHSSSSSSSSSSTKTIIQRTTIRTRMNAHTDNNNDNMTNTLEISFDWNDRIRLQDQYTLKEKGWKVHVDWRLTPFGAGLFSKEDIPAGTILRKGILDVNLKEFTSIADIEEFCNQRRRPKQRHNHSMNDDDDVEQQQQQETISRLNYVKDYLWGYNKDADERGYYNDQKQDNNGNDNNNNSRFFGMWIPGNGLNHNEDPNTVYKSTNEGIDLIALVDIGINDELFDDYRRHGSSSLWLKEFAHQNNVTLNFADCNDFM